MYKDAVEKKYMSKEDADKERDKYIATINSITKMEEVKIWYEKSFMPLVQIEDISKKYMKEPEPSEIKELELTPEEELGVTRPAKKKPWSLKETKFIMQAKYLICIRMQLKRNI